MRSEKVKIILCLIMVAAVFAVVGPINIDAGFIGDVIMLSDGTLYPDDAPISISPDEITYTLTDDISGSITIQKSGITLDGAGYNVIGSEINNGIYLNGLSDVTIQNLNITGFECGINLYESANNIIIGNSVTDCYYGIVLVQSSNNNLVTGNTVSGALISGVATSNSKLNNITDNIIINNGLGVYCRMSSLSVIISNNQITGNSGGIRIVEGSNDGTVSGNNASNNTKFGIQMLDVSNWTITENLISKNNGQYGLHLQDNSENNKITKNLVKENNGYGIFVKEAENNIFTYNTILSNTGGGIYLWYSGNSTVDRNTISNNDGVGIGLREASNFKVSWNTVIYQKWPGSGISLSEVSYSMINNNNSSYNSRNGIAIYKSNNNTIHDNTVWFNNESGLDLYGMCNNSIIEQNTILNNLNIGIVLDAASETTIRLNTVSNNNVRGIYLKDSINTLIYHNNITDNPIQAYDTNPANNNWHHPEKLEGNYWSDYPGFDDGSGIGKHAIAGDGIGDTAIPHPDTNYDFYPFTNLLKNLPEANADGPYIGYEGSEITFDASLSINSNEDPLQYRWDFDNDGTWDTEYSLDPTSSYTWYDDYCGSVTVEVYNGVLTDTGTTMITIINADPIITSITSIFDPTQVNTIIEITGDFTDSGTLDTHTALIDWGDETSSPGIVAELNGSGTTTGSHIYENPGVYKVTLTIFDDDGGEASATTDYVVIYDPAGEFVTGGGLIDSPEEAFPEDPSLTGKAGFGFVSKYRKGASTPDGNSQFRFYAADITFQSSSYDWLVVAGPKAIFKGTGTINGSGNFGFLISAIDGDMPGGGGVDRVRIKIWDKEKGDIVIYDNGLGDADDADPATPLIYGRIKIYKD